MDHDTRINPEKYEVFVMHCPASAPFIVLFHPWFVCNEKGKISRWEVLFRPNKDKSWGHLHLNLYSPFSGIAFFPYLLTWQWQGHLVKKVEGELAKKMIEFIKMSKENYPYLKRYSLCGTNSNTYAQWVLSNFPELDVTLPWNALGKNAK